VPVKPAITRSQGVHFSTRVDNREGVCGFERGWQFLRGEDSEGKRSRDGCGTKQGHEAWACQETAERLREPESGTEVSLENSLLTGLA
jgi:hypothetical protein